MVKQPKALRLAELIEENLAGAGDLEIAAELRLLHGFHEQLIVSRRRNAVQSERIYILTAQRDELLKALIDMVDYYGTASANVQQLDAAKSAIAKSTGDNQ